MTPYVRSLFNRAVLEHRLDGVVSTDLMAKLAAEGYDLGQLETDIEKINDAHALTA